jgi:hypothetical protein
MTGSPFAVCSHLGSWNVMFECSSGNKIVFFWGVKYHTNLIQYMHCQVIVKGFVLRDTFNLNYFRFSITLLVNVKLCLNKICYKQYKMELKKVWRYQRANQKYETKEGNTMQWPKEKGQTITSLVMYNIYVHI